MVTITCACRCIGVIVSIVEYMCAKKHEINCSNVHGESLFLMMCSLSFICSYDYIDYTSLKGNYIQFDSRMTLSKSHFQLETLNVLFYLFNLFVVKGFSQSTIWV